MRRIGAFIAGTDTRYPAPADGVHALTGTFAPNLALQTAAGTTSVAALMQSARPVLLDLAGRSDLRAAAREWQPRIDVLAAETQDRQADALLLRPDAHVAWAASSGQSTETATRALQEALLTWCGDKIRV